MFLIFSASQLVAQEPPYSPAVLPASEDWKSAIKRMRVPEGFRVELFAAEPMLANPVAFCLDERGRVYVAETFRLHAGVTDNRNHMYWLADDLASRTVDDRVAMHRKHLGKDFASYGIHHDRVRMIEDTDGDGRADRSTVFADGFRGPAEGIGSGVLARGGSVWYTCIPHLWLLKDTNTDGVADERKPLHSGFGVHVAFIGHDLHGLCTGPDGRLYFSIGDRGINVQTGERRLEFPDTGSVLRCEPDGSNLEVFAFGLRNPQELAFDDFGNLFTGDNNSDSGDQARLVYVVEGGDSGWRIGYQYLNWPTARGPWNYEKLWHPYFAGQAAYIVPPIVNLGDGPSGLTYYSGVGLPERYRRHFFLADFRGGSPNSGIRSFAVKPRGAWFEITDQHEFLWSVLATDVDFGPDCNLYISDWTEGWQLPKQGRIYRIVDSTQASSKQAGEVKQLLGEAFDHRPIAQLKQLLGHADRRVRQEAQFALAAKGTEGRSALEQAAARNNPLLARIHAIWGLGQIGRKDVSIGNRLAALLEDPDPEVRAQAAKTLGDVLIEKASTAGIAMKLMKLLGEPRPRVQFFAAMALGSFDGPKVVPAILSFLRENADRDPYLRHAGVMALTGIDDREALLAAAGDPSPAVRRGVLLALRRKRDPGIARFLDDADLSIVVEAARGVNDEPIDQALPTLAAQIERRSLPDELAYRALNANFRIGSAENAAKVAAYALRTDVSETSRVEAVKSLADWSNPSGLDRVMGLWRPLPKREPAVVANAVRPLITSLLAKTPDRVRREAIDLAGKLQLREAGPGLLAILANSKMDRDARLGVVDALSNLGDDLAFQAMNAAMNDKDALVRVQGFKLLADRQPAAAAQKLATIIEQGDARAQQTAIEVLGTVQAPEATALLSSLLDKLLQGRLSQPIQLDVIEAARRNGEPSLIKRLSAFEEQRNRSTPVAAYSETLLGGDKDRGEKVYREKTAVGCVRCHKIAGRGGDVGPDLSEIGKTKSREYLLEALVEPNREIAKGFETAVLATTDGSVLTGIVRSEDGETLRIIDAEAKYHTIKKSDIEARSKGKSAMPEDVVKHLTRLEIRDLVEYLSTLK